MPRKAKKRARRIGDRERILMNIVTSLAHDLYSLKLEMPHPLKELWTKDNSLCRTRIPDRKPKVGDLVLAWFSACRLQQHQYTFGYVEKILKEDKGFMDSGEYLIRAVGSRETTRYHSESMIVFEGIPERVLWEGQQRIYARRIKAAFTKLDDFKHRFRWLTFTGRHEATVSISEVFGGVDANGTRAKPYDILLKLSPKITREDIIQQLKKGGFGTREFEMEPNPNHGKAVMTIHHDFNPG